MGATQSDQKKLPIRVISPSVLKRYLSTTSVVGHNLRTAESISHRKRPRSWYDWRALRESNPSFQLWK